MAAQLVKITSAEIRAADEKTEAAVRALCPQCGLCCNGVLFADVRLQVEDDARRLALLGVSLQTRGKLTRLSQPCSCLKGNFCRIYENRPSRCRSFECRLLKRAQADEVTERAALKSIEQAKRHAENVRRILRELGDTDESVPLSRRYQRMMRQPIELSDGRASDLRGELMMAVAELVAVLERDFLS